MNTAECAQSPAPASRFVRLKKVLVVERDRAFGPPMRDAIEQSGYYPNLVTDPLEARRRVHERRYDLVVISSTIGREALSGILEMMMRHGFSPLVLLVMDRDSEVSSEEMKGFPGLSVVRHPCSSEDVAEAVRALLGSPWPDDREAHG